MSKLKLYHTEAIVLKKADLGEADRILTLYTPHLGKIRAVAKGVRRPQSKLGGHIEPLSHSEMLLTCGQTLDIVSQGQAIESFLPLYDDLWRASWALYAAELVDKFTPEGEENFPIFSLLLDTLHQLCLTHKGELILCYFELHLLDHLGYRPQLQRCLNCNSPLRPTSNFFSPSGGVLCPLCRYQEAITYPLSLNALKTLRFLQWSDYSTASQLRINPELSLELEQIMQRYISYLLEAKVKSAEWLKRLRAKKI
jgi:DNA repair protein RecO (recombination protein O)